MEKTYITTSYDLKWKLKKYPHYKITEDKKVLNTKTNRFLKRSVNCCSVGYWFGKKFIPLSKINQEVELIKLNKIPF